METEIGSNCGQIDVVGMSNGRKKKSLEWDLNCWGWDGNLFLATPLNAARSECANKELHHAQEVGGPSNGSLLCSKEIDFGIVGRESGEPEKRRRISPSYSEAVGEHAYTVTEADRSSQEERNGRTGSSTGPSCQVDGCQADLSDARDYHRRHKVCQMHSKASKVLVKNTEQRFCQQCSRFHLLQVFDEGKKSCRRRLASHNGRRRKTQAVGSSNGSSLPDNNSLSYILLSLLRILSNLEPANASDQSNGLNPLVTLLKNLATVAGSPVSRDNAGLIQASQDLLRNGTSAGTSSEAANAVANGFTAQKPSRPSSTADKEPPVKSILKDFDLNDACSDQGDCVEDRVPMTTASTKQANSPNWPSLVLNKSIPTQKSSNPVALSAWSLGCNGDDQSRTDRIVFKLFGKEPSDFPLDLRSQIFNWLSCCPSDMESYIRPGCIVLTVYLRLPNLVWEELNLDLSSWMEKLISITDGDFWNTGWIYARVQHHMALLYDGAIVLGTPWQPRIDSSYQMLCVAPIAVPCSSTANFSVEGIDLAQSTARLLCGFNGKYVVQETTQALATDDSSKELGSQCLSFSCSFPKKTGRGFIEVEDYDHSSLFFPFVVAEEDICSEIRMLENDINAVSCNDILEEKIDWMGARSQALSFLQEIGWLLQRSHLRAISEQIELEYPPKVFHAARFRWLVSFAVDREWCAVIKKLLDILFQGNIDLDGSSPVEFALGEDLLHNAVRKRSKSLVELLLRYTTNATTKDATPTHFLFTPDMIGPSNITPLHIAATISEADGVLDALIDDPQQLGIKAWKNARDVTGFTPEDYACKRGHTSYIQIVQDKIDSTTPNAHVSVTIPSSLLGHGLAEKQTDGSKPENKSALNLDNGQLHCKRCVQRVAYRPTANAFLSTRPLVLSMVAIAAVCVCVGLIMKSPPEVCFAPRPFLWSSLGSGYI